MQLPTNDFEVLDSVEVAEHFTKKRGPYKTRQVITPIVEFDPGVFIPLTESEVDKEFELEMIPVEVFDDTPNEYAHKKGEAKNRPICFIDGEGSNDGEKTMTLRKGKLRRWVQKQNYSLLGATIQGGEYRCIIGIENYKQLSTRQCLEFILSLPADHVIVGYSLTYDIEHWLKDLRGVRVNPDKLSPMERLVKTQAVWWHGYRIHYIPNKIFTIGKYKGQKKIASRTVYDIFGFFQSSFKVAIHKWDVGTPEERDFIERMKDTRPDFGPITEEVKSYNKMEGIHGIQMFAKVRKEYHGLELTVPRPVGAGSIASAIFRKHGVQSYYPPGLLLPTETMLSAFFGGRFDLTRMGFVGDTHYSDINSAYPHIARNLPCLRCGRYKRAKEYEPSEHSLWLVQWEDNGTRWSPFPYRTDNGNIRYYQNGTGWYYDAEVREALAFNPGSVEVIGGYSFTKNCEHRPFAFIDEYYERRQQLLLLHDFAEIIIKLGLNSVYGKLAQSKGRNPRWQQMIWAGLITSGTRAMLLSAIRQNPDAVVKVATDAVFSTTPLQLDYDESRLGAWKVEVLSDLLILGNGVYHSPYNSKDGKPLSKNRGFARDSKLLFDWDVIRENYKNGITSVVVKKEFRRFVKAFHEKRLEERCHWIDMELDLKLDLQKMKRMEGEYIHPLPNPTPDTISAPADIPNLNQPSSSLP